MAAVCTERLLKRWGAPSCVGVILLVSHLKCMTDRVGILKRSPDLGKRLLQLTTR